MVKLWFQKNKKTSRKDEHIQQIDFVDVCKHDVRSVAAMLCEVMRGKPEVQTARGRKCRYRQYELELDKLKKRQEVSDFLLQSKSVPLSEASQQTKLLCTLVKGMLRSDANQLTAKAAAKHEFFSLVFRPTSLENQLAGRGQNIQGGIDSEADN